MANKQLIILRGIPGSGKSTYQKRYHPHAIVVSADSFLTVDGKFHYNPTQIPIAHGKCFRATIEAMQNNAPLIVVDNQSIYTNHISPYILLSDAFAYDSLIISLHCDPVVATERNIHGVPSDYIYRASQVISTQERYFSPNWNHKIVNV